MNERSFLQFDDFQECVASRLGTDSWITVYEYTEKDGEKVGYFCALVKPEVVDRCLDNTSWDLLIGQGLPGFVHYFADGTHQYLRFGDDDGVEPFIIDRDFHGLKPSYLEISEEFRHFHNLFEDRRSGVFIALDDNGDDVEVIRMAPKKVQVRAKFLKDYLAARGMYMLLFFELDRWSTRTLEEIGMEKQDEKRGEGDYMYSRWVAPWDGFTNQHRKVFARIIGKKVIKGTENYRPASLLDREGRQYEDFIIGADSDGNDVRYTSDDEQLSNYFGKNPGSPHYLTPVFFRKAVMNKYYSDPAKYRVEDGNLYCGGYWGLRLDNNHPDYVTVYLGDLGKLAHQEQLYWKSFNVVPDGGISEVAFRRGFLAEWTDADEPALAFKAAYGRFRDGWREKFGWDLFKPLGTDDEHYWRTLHVPASENQKEFDDQVMALAKLLIERLNEREIAKHITVEANDKGITKFEKYLDAMSFIGRGQFIALLRNLNGLRSGPAHVKGKDYERAAIHFDLNGKGLSRAFAELISDATDYLIELQGAMLPKE